MAPRFFSERQLDTTPSVAPRASSRAMTDGLRNVDAALTQRQRQVDAVYVTERDAEMRQHFATEFERRRNEARGEAETFTDDLLREFDDWTGAISDAPSATARQALETRAATFRAELAVRGETFQIAQAAQHRSDALGRAIQSTANAIRSDGTLYESSREALLENLAAAGEALPADAMADLTRAAEQEMAMAVMRHGIDEDPAAALAALNSGDYDERLSATQKNTLMNQAQAEIDRLRRLAEAERAVEAGAYRDAAKDYIAYLRAGGTKADAQFATSELNAMLGAEEGAEFAEEIDRAWDFGSDAAVMQDGTPEEANAILAQRGAGLESHEDFRAHHGDFQDLVKMREDAIEARDEDPAAVALRTPSVQRAYQNLLDARENGDQATWDQAATKYARANQAEQERRGTPSHLRRVLPNADLEAWGRLIEGATPQEGAELMGQFNRHWGQDGLSQLSESLAIESPALAMAAFSFGFDPRMSSQIMDGLRILSENNDLRPTKLEVEGRLQDAYASLFEFNPEIRDDFREAAVALYVRDVVGSADSDTFDPEIFDRALQRVGGGVVDARGQMAGGPFVYGGRTVLPLRPGGDEDEWLTALYNLDDDALRTYGNGVPTVGTGRVAMLDILEYGEPVSVGFGRYMFFLDGLGFIGTDGTDPVFMIDLAQFDDERGAGFKSLAEIEDERTASGLLRQQMLERQRTDRLPGLNEPPIGAVR